MPDVKVRHRQGTFSLEADISFASGWTVIFGPSGAGKTTLLRVLAGLITPDEGRVNLAGKTLLDTSKGIAVGPGERSIGFVTQQSNLFPHKTVRENVGFGIRHLGRKARGQRIAEMLRMFGAEGLADRRTTQLSGGERQRVALARALAPAPQLLLLDEPLAGLDDASAHDILARLLALNIRVVYVSHELAEIWRIPGDVILLEGGRITASGPLRDVLAPRRDELLRQLSL